MDCRPASQLIGALHIYDRNSNISKSPDILDDNLGPFKVKSEVRAPVSKDITLEIFLATIENNYMMLIATYLSQDIRLCTSCVHLKILLSDCRTKVRDLLF